MDFDDLVTKEHMPKEIVVLIPRGILGIDLATNTKAEDEEIIGSEAIVRDIEIDTILDQFIVHGILTQHDVNEAHVTYNETTEDVNGVMIKIDDRRYHITRDEKRSFSPN